MNFRERELGLESYAWSATFPTYCVSLPPEPQFPRKDTERTVSPLGARWACQLVKPRRALKCVTLALHTWGQCWPLPNRDLSCVAAAFLLSLGCHCQAPMCRSGFLLKGTTLSPDETHAHVLGSQRAGMGYHAVTEDDGTIQAMGQNLKKQHGTESKRESSRRGMWGRKACLVVTTGF